MTQLQSRLNLAAEREFGTGAATFAEYNAPGTITVVVRRPDGVLSDKVYMKDSQELLAMGDAELQSWLSGLFVAGFRNG